MKKCKDCGIDLNTGNSYPILTGRQKGQMRSYCKNCDIKRSYTRNIKEEVKRERDGKQAKKRGVVLGEYKTFEEARNDFINKFGGKCYACGSTTSLCLDHCHITGKIRGILCRRCNAALGFIGDDLEILQKLIDYLKREF